MGKRKDRFVVGYTAAKNAVYGSEPPTSNISPMTLNRAKRNLKKMPCNGAAIFELVVKIRGDK